MKAGHSSLIPKGTKVLCYLCRTMLNHAASDAVNNWMDTDAKKDTMEILTHTVNDTRIAEITSGSILIHSPEEGLDLLGNIYYQGFDKMIIHERCITPDFFDLKNGIAGELLQKFSNYRMPLAIVGDFSRHVSNSIKDFIRESNQRKQVIFVDSVDEAIRFFSGK